MLTVYQYVLKTYTWYVCNYRNKPTNANMELLAKNYW